MMKIKNELLNCEHLLKEKENQIAEYESELNETKVFYLLFDFIHLKIIE